MNRTQEFEIQRRRLNVKIKNPRALQREGFLFLNSRFLFKRDYSATKSRATEGGWVEKIILLSEVSRFFHETIFVLDKNFLTIQLDQAFILKLSQVTR